VAPRGGCRPVKVGVEAAGHYHRALLGSRVWPAGWEVVVLSPARVSGQRRVQGRRRVKTDAIDLEVITEMGAGWSWDCDDGSGGGGHRAQGVGDAPWPSGLARTATKNRLLAQLDRCFPGLTMVLPDVLGTRVGRLVAAEFADPHRLAALGVSRLVRFAANRGLRVRRLAAEWLGAAGRAALLCPEAQVARQVFDDDLVLLVCLDAQIVGAEAKLAQLLPDTPFAPLTTVPGWGTGRAANYGAAVGDLDRWPGASQLIAPLVCRRAV
jgi:transposase